MAIKKPPRLTGWLRPLSPRDADEAVAKFIYGLHSLVEVKSDNPDEDADEECGDADDEPFALFVHKSLLVKVGVSYGKNREKSSYGVGVERSDLLIYPSFSYVSSGHQRIFTPFFFSLRQIGQSSLNQWPFSSSSISSSHGGYCTTFFPSLNITRG